MRCPECSTLMEEGLMPVSDGLRWLRGRTAASSLGTGAGSVLAEDVPGTHAVMRPNRMEGWRCKKCHLILFRYGQSWEANKQAQMRVTTDEAAGGETPSEA